jgi:hypothetical protein
MVPFIQTKMGINLVVNGKPVAVATQDKHYNEVVAALKAGATSDDITAILEKELQRVTAATKLSDKIEVKGGELFFEGEVIHNTLADRILSMVDEGFTLTPMVNFLENLMQNPSMRVVEHLYAFLEKGKNAITEDGCFLAYKAVRADFLDIHSGTFDNSVGKVLSMPRRKVDEDPNRTCSHGFHVCSFDYLPHFAHANGHVMICKVNPRDVVAIPADYNNTKMRVASYEVIGEYDGYYKREDRSDVLGATSVLNGNGSEADFPFEVKVIIGRGASETLVGNFAKLSEAAEKMDELMDDDTVYEVIIGNRRTGIELERQKNDDYDDSNDDNVITDEEFEVRVFKTSNDFSAGVYTIEGSFDDVSDAKSCAAVDVDMTENFKVQVVNTETGAVLLSASQV